ncbi:MAG: IS30 family transposase, partial [Candidatus Hydrogenedens sp.]|nr:IS30 family transposase [Candidatus Hydrogenedens sp.]
MSPHHFTLEDRIKLEAFLEAGLSKKAIGEHLGFHPSSIGREIKRNSIGGRYIAQRAHNRAQSRRKEIERPRKWDHEQLRRYVIDMTMRGWSPEQVSGRLP